MVSSLTLNVFKRKKKVLFFSLISILTSNTVCHCSQRVPSAEGRCHQVCHDLQKSGTAFCFHEFLYQRLHVLALNVLLRDVSLSAGSFPRTTCCRPCRRSSTTCRPRAPWSTRTLPMPWRGCSPCEAPTTARCEDHQLEMLIFQKWFFFYKPQYIYLCIWCFRKLQVAVSTSVWIH